jgi:hypothetical protein
MRYNVDVLVQPNTSASTPTIGEMVTPRGMIRHCELQFSHQVQGTIQCLVTVGGYQIYPAVSGKYFTLWEPPISFDDMYPLFPNESYFQLIAWSNYNSYYHRIGLHIDIMPFTGMLRKVK